MLKQNRTFWGMFIVLTLFWLIVAGAYDMQVALTGLVVSYFITYFNRDILISEEERPLFTGPNLMWLLRFAKDFMIAVLKANVQVAYLVLSPRLPIAPGVIRFEPGLKKEANRVLLGNSITLTPGTLTVFCSQDEFMVHALTEENAVNLLEWELLEDLKNLEEEPHGSSGNSEINI